MTDKPDNPDSMGQSDRPDQSDMSDASDRSDRPVLSVTEAATLLGVNERTVRRYIEKGKLRADRLETDRHTIELRISHAALDDYRGRRGAVEHEAHTTDRLSDTPAPLSGGMFGGMSGPLSGRPADLPALVGAISDRLDAQYQARLADKDALIDELRRRADVAECEVGELRRARRQVPWWLRLFRGP